jgi:hypothetical protein
LGDSNPSEEEDQRGEQPTRIDVNMVFMIPAKFRALAKDITELTLGAGRAVFEKLENPGAHMTLIRHMLVDGGASINILPLSLFKKLGHAKGDLKHTNLSLSGFVGDPTEAKGIIYKELMVGSKTVPTTFFVVDVKGHYNMLLG